MSLGLNTDLNSVPHVPRLSRSLAGNGVDALIEAHLVAT